MSVSRVLCGPSVPQGSGNLASPKQCLRHRHTACESEHSEQSASFDVAGGAMKADPLSELAGAHVHVERLESDAPATYVHRGSSCAAQNFSDCQNHASCNVLTVVPDEAATTVRTGSSKVSRDMVYMPAVHTPSDMFALPSSTEQSSACPPGQAQSGGGSGHGLSLYPPFIYSTTYAVPQPDMNGSALGIPVPLQQAGRSVTPSGSRTPLRTPLPPLPTGSMPPLTKQEGTPSPAPCGSSSCTAAPGPSSETQMLPAQAAFVSSAASANAQYRRVYVPRAVTHNGVTQNLLMPMWVMVAPMAPQPLQQPPGHEHRRRGGDPASGGLRSSVCSIAARAVGGAGSAKRASGKASRKVTGVRAVKARSSGALSSASLGVASVGASKTKPQQSRYGTRQATGSRRPSWKLMEESADAEWLEGAEVADAVMAAPACSTQQEKAQQSSNTDALSMLADAALLDAAFA